MATRNEIFEKINSTPPVWDTIRRDYIRQLSEYTGRDTILYSSAFPCKFQLPAPLSSVDLNDIQGFMTCFKGLKGNTLDIIIHSPGGSLEAADQIVQYLRNKYCHIRAIVPQNAMSAATMIACACDEIVMGKQSAIGPIDPQMNINGTVIPAHSILSDFEKARDEIANNPQLSAVWGPKLMSIPHGYLDLCQKNIELSKSKVGEWLNNYMFKNSEKKGEEIANWLGDFKEHKTHGRPIGYEISKGHGINVIRLEDDQALQDLVLSVFHSTQITFDMTRCVKIIENHIGNGMYVTVN